MSRRVRQRGFTLVEVMVSLVISALLVGMVLSIFSRMSQAYRGQQSVAELQQILAAAHNLIASDLRQAGFQVQDGFFVSGDQRLHQPVEIENNADGFGPDILRVYYGDASAQARVVDFNGAADSPGDPFTSIEVDDARDFVPGDVVVIVKSVVATASDVKFHACVLQIETITPGASTAILGIDGAGVWGSAAQDQCDIIRTDPALGPDNRAMVYRFRARAYRIDPGRRDLAVLQVSPSAGFAVVSDWQDLAVGFTDLQIASRWDDSDDPVALASDTVDLDNDAQREWYSDVTQQYMSATLGATVGAATPYALESYSTVRPRLLAVRVSLVVRTHTKVDLVPSQRTPKLVDDARPGNNDLGDRDAVQLEGVADALRPAELHGEHVYRHSTVGTDLRNLGVGR